MAKRIPNPDPNGLFREETISDPKVGAIRRMIPVTADGLPDPDRDEKFIGELTVMTPMGALPLTFEIPAKSLSDAVAGFADAAEKQLERMQDELRRLELEQSSLLAKQALVGGGLKSETARPDPRSDHPLNRRDFLRRFPAMVSAVASAAVAPAVLLRAATAGAANRAAVVAAASDLKYALDAVAERYAAQGNPKPKLIFGSSGNFTRQIQQGAPFDLFLSADESYIAQLVASGLTRDAGVVYAVGRIGIAVPPGSPVQADRDLAGLRRALAAGKVKRFAIANPEHAPYGKRAQEALQYAGLWEAIQPYLVLGENIAQAMQFALSGGAQGGIIALSLEKAPPVAPRLGGFALIPEAWHTPLVQRMALLRAAHPEAERFYAYLQGNDARAILAQYGFVLP